MTDLDELKALRAKMTQGVWRYSTSPQPNGCPIIGADGMMVAMLAHSVNYPDQRKEAIANAGGIVALVNAADDLIARVERAEAENKRLREALENILERGYVSDCIAEERHDYLQARAALEGGNDD